MRPFLARFHGCGKITVTVVWSVQCSNRGLTVANLTDENRVTSRHMEKTFVAMSSVRQCGLRNSACVRKNPKRYGFTRGERVKYVDVRHFPRRRRMLNVKRA